MDNALDTLEAIDTSTPVVSVPCVYCRGAIPASTFAFWTNARRLLSAECPQCHRRVTLTALTWRRWLAMAREAASTAQAGAKR